LIRDVLGDPFGEVMAAIEAYVVPLVAAGQICCVVIDTLSTLAQRMLNAFHDNVSTSGWDIYPAITRQVDQIIGRLQSMGVWVIALCHKQPPNPEKGRRGGPKLPGSLVDMIPGLFSLILQTEKRVINNQTIYVYVCEQGNKFWHMKDRWGVAHPLQVADLRPMIYQRLYPNHPVPEFPPIPIRVAAQHAGVIEESAQNTQVAAAPAVKG
jgi:hypothetical protein